MKILNIAGYKFIALTNLATLSEDLLTQLKSLKIKGTVLLSEEGININLAGTLDAINEFKKYLSSSVFSDIKFHESYSESFPFHHLKVKIKKEIITMRQDNIKVDLTHRAPTIQPQELKKWLDTQASFTLLDTRNAYETEFGTFKQAKKLPISDFSEFPQTISAIEKRKPLVMFCTGGIRCEKAALYLLNEGFKEVYQLEGGILGYFAQCGGKHYEGECFVFDERIALDSTLAATGTKQCTNCEGPIRQHEQSCSQCKALF